MKKNIFSSLFIILFFSFTGCTPKIPQYSNVQTSLDIKKLSTKEKLLLKRFSEYWHYRLNRDFNKTFPYELPYQRYVTDFSWYKDNLVYSYGRGKVVLNKIEYQDVNHTIITKEYFGQKGTHTKDTEEWFYVIDNWYHKFYQHIMPPD